MISAEIVCSQNEARSSPFRCCSVKMSSAEQSIDVAVYFTPSAPVDDGDVSPVSKSGHCDHSVVNREGSAAPKRADVASERAVPGCTGGHCGRPHGKGLHNSQTPSTLRADSSRVLWVRIRGRWCHWVSLLKMIGTKILMKSLRGRLWATCFPRSHAGSQFGLHVRGNDSERWRFCYV